MASFAALIALMLNVLIPQGFMASSSQDGPPGLVLCTGAGPLMVALGPDGKPGKAPAAPAKPDSRCAFAGHGAATPLAQAPVLPVVTVAWQAMPAPARTTRAQTPGLAAPPPPAIGPPRPI